MLLKMLDSLGISQTIITKGQEATTDGSGVITATGVSQLMLAANTNRSGWFVQNNGSSPMWINDRGVAASATVSAGAGSFHIQPGATFSSVDYACSTTAINILGTIGDGYTVREW